MRVAKASGRTITEQLHRPLREFMAEELIILAAEREKGQEIALDHQRIGKDEIGLGRILYELSSIHREG